RQAQLRFPWGLALDSNGNLYVADDENNVIRKLTPVQQSPQISSAATASEFGAMAAVTSGSWMEIHGVSLASHTRSWTQDDFNADSAPTSLDGTSVTIGGRPGFISFISPTQVNVLLPDGVSPGDQEVTITTAAGSTLPHISAVMAAQPGLLAA